MTTEETRRVNLVLTLGASGPLDLGTFQVRLLNVLRGLERLAGPDWPVHFHTLVPDRCRQVADGLIRAVEDAGGVVRTAAGLHEPVADREWVDLGATYVNACRAVGRAPLVTEEEGEGDADV